ncbi:hypothetical protein AAHA92_16536 [Salvia divinorum]|uniref:F-box/LRR-repeat protein 15/At3g58940/PEG3-like LRR domain-containing protein n=1 Tax=Salvia divinorum TaxID=28513 RepID=A0ABD1GZ79_SALDI
MHQLRSTQFYWKAPWTADASDVYSWLLFAIGKQVEGLSMSTYTLLCKHFHRYSPPPPLYSSCSTITKLSLHDCDTEIKENNEKWEHLKSLTFIDKQYCIMSAHAMAKILLGSPRLEYLILDICVFRGNFDIRSPSLKTLKVEDAWYTPHTQVMLNKFCVKKKDMVVPSSNAI